MPRKRTKIGGLPRKWIFPKGIGQIKLLPLIPCLGPLFFQNIYVRLKFCQDGHSQGNSPLIRFTTWMGRILKIIRAFFEGS